ncbi:VOC family protein [Halobacillus sp. BBL2006]|uniref:VOC family protein n=1 Tax=Halobacillus sp. BBL2006 TaxID=1543706 RepID=UPI000543FD62|nr:VOC family protein [Halobacillus sp. BBL2006]KHE66992.1 glyoxalase [Halobacillus sp. BBL2006]
MEKHFFQKPNTYVGHVEIKVSSLEKSKNFYRDILGLQILEQTDTKVSFTTDGKSSILSIEQPDRVKPKPNHTAGLYHFAILLPNRTELGKVLKHFIEIDLRLGASDHLVSEALYLNDPDGNGIEIYSDRPSDLWEWKGEEVKMAVDPLNGDDLLQGIEEKAWEGLPAQTVMGHIHLHVADMSETQAFYAALGFNIVSKLGNQASFMSTGGYHHHLGLNTWNGPGVPPTPEDSVGLKSFTLIFPDIEKREEAVRKVRSLGYSIEEGLKDYKTEDPSGNKMILKVNP